ncbi:MAG TPA: hypothetical protein VFR78_13240 [Pyrinomonadaceae bacterium]|nr:hypothetical protein [Pyrinomonadaceae bacterium]
MGTSKSTYLVLVVVITVMVLSVTLFKGREGSANIRQDVRAQNRESYQDRLDRYPVVEAEETEPVDPLTKAKLKKQKERYDKDAPFTNPGPKDEELAFRPEWQFNFPALPVVQSDLIVMGQVLSAEAHRSNNKMNVFSNFELRVEEVLKGNAKAGDVINIQRIGGFVKYPNGQKVLFRLSGNGMPGVGARYVFFLNVADEDYTILTAYELGQEGVVPLDNSAQFQMYKGVTETSFTTTLREAISKALPQ